MGWKKRRRKRIKEKLLEEIDTLRDSLSKLETKLLTENYDYDAVLLKSSIKAAQNSISRKEKKLGKL